MKKISDKIGSEFGNEKVKELQKHLVKSINKLHEEMKDMNSNINKLNSKDMASEKGQKMLNDYASKLENMNIVLKSDNLSDDEYEYSIKI